MWQGVHGHAAHVQLLRFHALLLMLCMSNPSDYKPNKMAMSMAMAMAVPMSPLLSHVPHVS